MILIIGIAQPWYKLKENLLSWLKNSNFFLNHDLFRTTKMNTSRME
jgi:hypothetical protein